jgi:hypothetical protein
MSPAKASTTTPGVPDARALLRVAPDDYVAERTRLAKEARAAGDRALAKSYTELKRPNLSLWAVLAAADDADAVHLAVSTTTELGKVQIKGGTSAALSSASQRRRKAVEVLVDRAVEALAKWVPAAETRRGEIRDIVDQLSRQPDLAEAWIDGTLRDPPDEVLGFAAFADMPVAATSRGGTANKTAPPDRTKARTERAPAAAEPPAVRQEEVRRARRDVTTATRELATAQRRLDVARRAAHEAEEALQDAEQAHVATTKRHDEATAALEAVQRRL